MVVGTGDGSLFLSADAPREQSLVLSPYSIYLPFFWQSPSCALNSTLARKFIGRTAAWRFADSPFHDSSRRERERDALVRLYVSLDVAASAVRAREFLHIFFRDSARMLCAADMKYGFSINNKYCFIVNDLYYTFYSNKRELMNCVLSDIYFLLILLTK